jgi:membrane-associated phospholipid phosphatase
MRGKAITAILCATTATIVLAEVRRRQTRALDWSVLASLRGTAPRGLRRAVAVIEKPAAVLVQAAVLALVASRKPRASAALLGAPGLALGASLIAKHAFNRARPPWHLFQRDGLSSFPSGHTAGTSALAWTLASVFRESPPLRIAGLALASAEIALVAYTRVSDCDHWPTDTLAGAAIGIAASEALCLLTRSPAGAQPSTGAQATG